MELTTRGGILSREWERQLAGDRVEGLGVSDYEVEELVGLVEEAAFNAQAELLAAEGSSV